VTAAARGRRARRRGRRRGRRAAWRARLRACTLLLVDDEEANLDLLEALLGGEGYGRLVRTGDPREVPALAARHAPDLVLLDLHMPHRHGLDVLADLRAATPAGEYRPVLVLTADATWEARERALALGARDFVTKPFDAARCCCASRTCSTRACCTPTSAGRASAPRPPRPARRSSPSGAGSSPRRSTRPPRSSTSPACSCRGGRPRAPPCSAARPRATRARRPRRSPTPTRPRGRRRSGRGRGAGRGAPVDADPDVDVARADADPAAAAAGALPLSPPVLEARARDADGVRGALVVAGPHAATDQALVDELAARLGLAAEHARLLAAAELATRERERLLAVVAHDLRNPLGAVSMYAEMLASLQPDDADAYTRGALATIHASAAGMQRLVEDLLDAASLRGGALRVHRTERRLGDLFDEAERMLRPLADAAGVGLAVWPEGGADDRHAPVDGARLVQLLSNLVGNAVKFTPAGGRIDVRYAVDPAGAEGGGALAASVTDTGPGIAAADLPHLFTAFWRGDRRDRPGTKRGAGLGLWIARAIVEAHGGDLGVASRADDGPERGTTFHFTLPFAARERRWED
jgi:signal transduction histidine kinase/DNA-binding NarL/FixJ family response regulator